MLYSKIGIGTVQFGLDYGISNKVGQTGVDEVKKILYTAHQYKINTLDTAEAYGNSEDVIGQTAEDGWEIISKFSSVAIDVGLMNLLQGSLNKLKRQSLNGYLAHNAEVLIKKPNLWDELLECRERGLTKKIGYSIYTPEELEGLLSLKMIPDIIQIPFNFLDRRFCPYFDKLKELNVAIHTRSAFLQGLFFMDSERLSDFFKPVKHIISGLQNEFGSTEKLANGLLKYCLDIEQIDKVIIGVNSSEQLVTNLSGLNSNMKNLSNYEHLIEPGILKDEIVLPYKWPQTKLK